MAAGDGTLYLLCFAPGIPNRPGRSAQHYLGYVQGGPENVERRLAEHLTGRGSPLVRAAALRGLEVVVARLWTPADRDTERRLKRRHEAPRLCPACNARGDAERRGRAQAAAA